jgi:hypothetical protein
MSFERIVRPFQRTGFTPAPAPAIVEPDEPLENLRFEIGKNGGTAKMLIGSESGSITAFTKTETKELSRETTERRVENPDDPSQYVIVEDTDSIESESGSRDTYKREETTFKPQT